MTTTTRERSPRPALLAAADTASIEALKYPPGWDRTTLETLAGHCRTAAGVFDLDPTLVDEPEDTGRWRVLWLIAELARGCQHQVQLSQTLLHRHDFAERQAEAEAILQRVGELTTRALVALPQATATDQGQLLVSQMRMAANYDQVRDAAELLRRAAEPALRLGTPDPLATNLQAVVEQLTAMATILKATHQRSVDALADAVGLPS